jgi:hypothetical protein
MKKLIILFLLFYTSTSFAQSDGLIYMVASGPWNTYTQKYDLTYRDVNMSFRLEKSVIYINDGANSVYITENSVLEQDDSRAIIVSWDARDERSRRCRIFMGQNHSTGDKSLIVTYSDYMFQYFYR